MLTTHGNTVVYDELTVRYVRWVISRHLLTILYSYYPGKDVVVN